MSMSSKYYNALAQALAASRPYQPDTSDPYATPDAFGAFHQWRADVESILNVLAADNPRFNAELFREATNQ